MTNGKENISPELMARTARLFKALGDPSRMRIVCRLLAGEACTQSFSEELRITKPAISHHIFILRCNDPLKSRRDGKYIYYTLSDDHIKSIVETAMAHVIEQDLKCRA